MNDIESILNRLELDETASEYFVSQVMKKIDRAENSRFRMIVSLKCVLFGLGAIVFFYALSLLIIDFLTAETFAFLTAGINNLDIAFTYEGMMTFWEATPIASLLFFLLAALFWEKSFKGLYITFTQLKF